jgi:hypothetical protein
MNQPNTNSLGPGYTSPASAVGGGGGSSGSRGNVQLNNSLTPNQTSGQYASIGDFNFGSATGTGDATGVGSGSYYRASGSSWRPEVNLVDSISPTQRQGSRNPLYGRTIAGNQVNENIGVGMGGTATWRAPGALIASSLTPTSSTPLQPAQPSFRRLQFPLLW